MEYVVVSYPENRKVRIDDKVAGNTSDKLMVEAGHHVFDLGQPKDYKPLSVEKIVRNTTSVTPLRINDFKPEVAPREPR
jgi:hypothetical protein